MFRARAIVIKDNALALIRRERDRQVYYAFPGGGQEPGETPEETVLREVREELGIKVAVACLVAEVNFRGQVQYYFLAHMTGGRFGRGTGPEMRGQYPASHGTYTPVWVSRECLAETPIQPVSVAALVRQAFESGWPPDPVRFVE